MKATLFSSSISANLGNSGEIHKYSVKKFMAATLSYFCELVESGGGGEQTNYIFHIVRV